MLWGGLSLKIKSVIGGKMLETKQQLKKMTVDRCGDYLAFLLPPSLSSSDKHILWVTAGANCPSFLFRLYHQEKSNTNKFWLPGKLSFCIWYDMPPPASSVLSPSPLYFIFPPFPSLPSLSLLSFSPPSLPSSTAGVWDSVFPLSLAHEGPH